jgi:hypothetical protein
MTEPSPRKEGGAPRMDTLKPRAPPLPIKAGDITSGRNDRVPMRGFSRPLASAVLPGVVSLPGLGSTKPANRLS